MSTVVDNVFHVNLCGVTTTSDPGAHELHRRVTIRDVAEHAGVSVATVSKVINDRYGVSSSTVAKVQAVIDDLGYESSLVICPPTSGR